MSLIQQRIAIDRQRTFGVVFLSLAGALFLIGAFSLATNPEREFLWTGVIIFGANTVLGVITLVSASFKRRAFEAEHGTRAGKQSPVRRRP